MSSYFNLNNIKDTSLKNCATGEEKADIHCSNEEHSNASIHFVKVTES